jgi:hypothetical protein
MLSSCIACGLNIYTLKLFLSEHQIFFFDELPNLTVNVKIYFSLHKQKYFRPHITPYLYINNLKACTKNSKVFHLPLPLNLEKLGICKCIHLKSLNSKHKICQIFFYYAFNYISFYNGIITNIMLIHILFSFS